jgi:parallel beta-helix repeat protein
MRVVLSVVGLVALSACSPKGFSEFSCKDAETTECIEVAIDDETIDLQDVVNSLVDDTTIVLGEGTWDLDNQVTFRGANDIALIGQGMDLTKLSFTAMEVQANGVDAIADDFRIEGLTIEDAVKDGLRIEDSSDIVIRRVRTTWSGGPLAENGGYGIYPVRVNRVLVEESEAYNASDAGIYVGQCVEAVVRNNVSKANVAGLEIENTQFADVYGNLVEDNTGGLVVFDLPGNPVIGRDVLIHDIRIINNNRSNFAPGGTVAQIPAGTGTFAMASRRVEITNNTYANNNTVDIALVSGMVVAGDPARWAIPKADAIGSTDGLAIDEDEDNFYNFRLTEIHVHGNSHSGSGTRPDNTSSSERPIGFLIAVTYGGTPVDTVMYDAIGESSFSATEASGNSNDHHICVGADAGVTFASLDLENLSQKEGVPNKSDLYRPPAPFTPFDCTSLTGGPVTTPTFAD